MQAVRGALSPLPMLMVLASLLLAVPGLLAGVWVWPTAWAFLAVSGGGLMLGFGLLAALRPASFEVRQQGLVARAEKKQPLIDALGLVGYAAFALGWLVFIPLDIFRLKLLAPPTVVVQGVGVGAVIAGLTLVFFAIGQNQFAAPTIHDQSGDGQRVIDTGLYSVMRHPLYAGMLLFYCGAALWLGSYAAAIACVGFLILTLARILIEERFLRAHLPDYADYARRVRARLVPGLF